VLQWTDNSDNEDGFRIEATCGTYTKIGTTGASVNVYEDSSLQFGKIHCYRVTAYNSGGDFGCSSGKCATTLGTAILSSPSHGATLDTNTVTLWRSSATGANGYAIKVSKTDCGGSEISNGTSTSCKKALSNLTDGVYYWQEQGANWKTCCRELSRHLTRAPISSQSASR
jgi:hypothetical protein